MPVNKIQTENSATADALPPVEKHPFKPFLPEGAKVLFLGSFPPQEKRWSMVFYYPNYTNDFWYMTGLLWYNDKRHFTVPDEKRFDYEAIVDFCRRTGFAMYDTATEVRRLKDNASDKFLEVVTPTDISALLEQIPQCRAIVTTGQKATETLVAKFHCDTPKMGESVKISIPVRNAQGETEMRSYDFYRLPSTSRAYPLSLDKKAAAYRVMFERLGML